MLSPASCTSIICSRIRPRPQLSSSCCSSTQGSHLLTLPASVLRSTLAEVRLWSHPPRTPAFGFSLPHSCGRVVVAAPPTAGSFFLVRPCTLGATQVPPGSASAFRHPHLSDAVTSELPPPGDSWRSRPCVSSSSYPTESMLLQSFHVLFCFDESCCAGNGVDGADGICSDGSCCDERRPLVVILGLISQCSPLQDSGGATLHCPLFPLRSLDHRCVPFHPEIAISPFYVQRAHGGIRTHDDTEVIKWRCALTVYATAFRLLALY